MLNMGVILMKKSVQDLIKELSKINFKDYEEEYLDKSKEILEAIASMSYVYTVLSKGTTAADIMKNRASLHCANNKYNHACIWIFSEKEIAEKWARKYGFLLPGKSIVEKGSTLVHKIKTKDLEEVTYKGVFKGVSDIVIDDGASWVCFSLKDFINTLSMKNEGKNKFSTKDFAFIQFFNKMKYENAKLYVIADSKYSLPEILKYRFLPYIKDDVIKIFFSKHKAEEYAEEYLDNAINAVPVDAVHLNNLMVQVSLKNENCTIEIDDEIKCHSFKLVDMLNLMSKIG